MSIIRINKNKNYVTMSNYHFKEKEMSLKAKGLLSEMLSLPDNWNYSIAGLVAINKENETAIKSTLNELKKFGYLKINKMMPNKTKTGRIEYIYDIFEKKQDDEKQEIENLGVEFQGVENQVQYNINNKILNNKIINNKKIKKEPTLEEIKNYINEKNYNVDAEVFYNYFKEANWIDSKGNKVKNWKQKLITWNSYNKKQENIPQWINQKQEKSETTKAEQEELKELLKEFK